ncbi:MAG TPA: hypothetical protein VEH31_28425 [Streptosporangiaceae bacterium]|nr:hypothetical protein [Streptosporangiaceae bacterium]
MPALIILLYAAAVYPLLLAVPGSAVGFFAGFAVPEGFGQGPRADLITPVDPGYDGALRSWSRPC